jgi:hypothetical protein
LYTDRLLNEPVMHEPVGPQSLSLQSLRIIVTGPDIRRKVIN